MNSAGEWRGYYCKQHPTKDNGKLASSINLIKFPLSWAADIKTKVKAQLSHHYMSLLKIEHESIELRLNCDWNSVP